MEPRLGDCIVYAGHGGQLTRLYASMMDMPPPAIVWYAGRTWIWNGERYEEARV